MSEGSAETTTIQVRVDQAAWLREVRGPSGSYKTALDKLREAHEAESDRDEPDLQALADRLDAIEARLIEADEERVVGDPA